MARAARLRTPTIADYGYEDAVTINHSNARGHTLSSKTRADSLPKSRFPSPRIFAFRQSASFAHAAVKSQPSPANRTVTHFFTEAPSLVPTNGFWRAGNFVSQQRRFCVSQRTSAAKSRRTFFPLPSRSIKPAPQTSCRQPRFHSHLRNPSSLLKPIASSRESCAFGDSPTRSTPHRQVPEQARKSG